MNRLFTLSLFLVGAISHAGLISGSVGPTSMTWTCLFSSPHEYAEISPPNAVGANWASGSVSNSSYFSFYTAPSYSSSGVCDLNSDFKTTPEDMMVFFPHFDQYNDGTPAWTTPNIDGVSHQDCDFDNDETVSIFDYVLLADDMETGGKIVIVPDRFSNNPFIPGAVTLTRNYTSVVGTSTGNIYSYGSALPRGGTPVDSDSATYFPGYVPVSGVMHGAIAPLDPAGVAQVSFTAPGGTFASGTKFKVAISASGSFSKYVPVPSGTYDVVLQRLTSVTERFANRTGASGLSGLIGSFRYGDIDGDNVVSIFDYIYLSDALDAVPSSPNWVPEADLDHDNVISIFDYIYLSDSFDSEGR